MIYLNFKKGLFEELFIDNKEYPELKNIQRLTPKEYNEVLILHAARKLELRFKQLASEDRYEEIIKLTKEISNLLNENTEDFSLPLSMITYSENYDTLPLNEDLYISRLDLLHNEKHTIKNFFKTLKYEMLTSEAVDFMVSFIRMSGLQLITKPLKELEIRKVPVRIITSTYMGITEPKALQHLRKFSNVQVKVMNSQTESFHTKAYLFKRESELNTVIIGSSNLSHSALINGFEINVKLPDTNFLPVYEQAKRIFNNTWESKEAIELSNSFIKSYQKFINSQRELQSFTKNHQIASDHKFSYVEDVIKPNQMQQNALKSLEHTRENGNKKGVIIAATGTGKTYLSAFDVKSFNPKRLLFIAHREELLDNAIDTFKKIFSNQSLFGKITGSIKEFEKPYIFSTVQSFHKEDTLSRFQSDDFDYIIVDEFHHAEAPTYKKVINHFAPEFLLGLTATPERMDGRDVLALCDHNIVYEIRLRDALDSDLLAPFHYFGVSDNTVDYSQIPLKNGQLDEDLLVKALNTNERTDYIIDMINTYGFQGDKMYGLGFCTNIEHAKYMSKEFNSRGYTTTFLTGQDSVNYREEVIKRLENENDPLELIFTVNIFNEGIDIPKVNIILFLRPTESSTIFIQQLGRGLRKIEGKEFVTILDFIGNYQKSFVVPLALSGQINQRAFDKDSLRVAVAHEFADLPAGSYVDLDPVTQKEILERIDAIKMNSSEMLKSLYSQFKNELGRAPEIMDFLYSEQSPSLMFFIFKHKSWVKTKENMRDLNDLDKKILDHSLMYELVERLENQFPIKWPYELVILEIGLENRYVTLGDIVTVLERKFATKVNIDKHRNLLIQAMERMSSRYKKQKWSIGTLSNNQFILNKDILLLIEDPDFYQYIKDRIDYGIIEFRRTFRSEHFLQKGETLTLYQNYTRNDLIFLFEAGVPEGTWREGVSRSGNHYCLFINLNKSEDIEDHLHYKDYFVDQNHFHWQSQNKTSHHSSVGQNYINHKERDIHIHLFVRKFDKMHGMTLPFTYLGEIDYVSSHGDQPMNILWKLIHPVPEDLFIDLIR